MPTITATTKTAIIIRVPLSRRLMFGNFMPLDRARREAGKGRELPSQGSALTKAETLIGFSPVSAKLAARDKRASLAWETPFRDIALLCGLDWVLRPFARSPAA
jgi:hypothetical protein